MDLTTLAVGVMAARNQSTAQSAAMHVLKQSLGADKAIAALVSANSQSLDQVATAASHLGTNLDISV